MYSIYGYNTDMRNVRWMGSLVRGDVFPDKGIIAKNTRAGFTINGKAYTSEAKPQTIKKTIGTTDFADYTDFGSLNSTDY